MHSADADFPSGKSGGTSVSLLQGALERDPESWERLRTIYEPLVVYWCKRYAKLGAHDAADIAQETLTAVFRSLHRFRRDRSGGSFRGWLRTIALNKIRDRLRKEKRRPSAQGGTTAQRRMVELPDPNVTQDSAEEATETKLILRKAMDLIRAEFSDSSWRAFWLTTVDERTAAEAAAELGLKVGAIYTAKSRVLARLRKLLQGLEDGDPVGK